jgi:hypothetical protein
MCPKLGVATTAGTIAMEELIELRQYIEAKNYDKALELVADLEEMSKEDKLNKIYSYGVLSFT